METNIIEYIDSVSFNAKLHEVLSKRDDFFVKENDKNQTSILLHLSNCHEDIKLVDAANLSMQDTCINLNIQFTRFKPSKERDAATQILFEPTKEQWNNFFKSTFQYRSMYKTIRHERKDACRYAIINGVVTPLQSGWNNGNSTIYYNVKPTTPFIDPVDAYNKLYKIFDTSLYAQSNGAHRMMVMLFSALMKKVGVCHWKAPIFDICANDSQSGKGYAHELCSSMLEFDSDIKVDDFGNQVSNCSGIATVTFKDNNLDELDFNVKEALHSGSTWICLDNARGHIQSTTIEAASTRGENGTINATKKYAPNKSVAVTQVMWSLTNNGVTYNNDMRNRIYQIKIDTTPVGHQWQKFDGMFAHEWIKSNINDVASYIYSILAAYMSDKSKISTNHSTFPDWSSAICKFLKVCGVDENLHIELSSVGIKDTYASDKSMLALKTIICYMISNCKNDLSKAQKATYFLDIATAANIEQLNKTCALDRAEASRELGRWLSNLFVSYATDSKKTKINFDNEFTIKKKIKGSNTHKHNL